MMPSLTQQDWRILRPAVYWLGGAMLLCAGGWLLVQAWSRQLARENHALQAKRHTLQTTIAAERLALQSAQADSDDLPHLLASGIGDALPERLVWIENLEKLQHIVPNESMQYRIGPPGPLAQQSRAGNTLLMATPLTLQYVARHEADFSRVHHAVQALPGRPRPVRCALTRNPAEGLMIDCEYVWLAFSQQPAQTTGKTP